MTPFTSLLIANRGEIACRIIRSARAAGLRTIAVYSRADAQAPHVAQADSAVCIGPAAAADSYLNFDAILQAARDAGAEAIHPGYGFLSENAEFARRVEAAGLVFVGPSPEAIEAMGDKARAKALMIAAGVPCVPGYQGDDQADTMMIAEAARIGFPIMVKASAGGGGKGMRFVSKPDDLTEALTRARSEARAAFGSDRLILEKAIQAPRHVEIQVIADETGTTIHLGERDCSVQRRHQKVVEEAPSPAVDHGLRAAMGAAAVAAAQAVGYRGAGTVEFLLDAEGAFYFLEMNTRLQVEHPVTEMVTGLDLVALQLAVAQGNPLPLGQEDVTLTGHAIEARLYAEDPGREFLPVTGDVALWRPAPGIRTDAGIATGGTVSPHYDPMLAKLIAHGPTRNIARQRLIRALDETALLGLTSNAAFLRDVLAHEGFAEGSATTAFLDTAWPGGWAPTATTPDTIARAAALLLTTEMRAAPGDPGLMGFASDGGLPIPLDLSVNDEAHALAVRGIGTDTITVAGADWSRTLSPRDLDLPHASAGGDLFMQIRGQHYAVRRHRPWADAGPADDGNQIAAPMPGLLVALLVAAGDTVTQGQTLAVLEAMKMQHQLTAPREGTVAGTAAEPGQQLATGAPIILLEDPT